MMETFCSITNKKIHENLLHAIQGKGRFGRFKTGIHCHNIEDKWYKFREERLKEIQGNLEKWICKTENLCIAGSIPVLATLLTETSLKLHNKLKLFFRRKELVGVKINF